ncbi:hypothetical protein ACS0TY_018288 [Phlomoides rotata]
MNYEKYKEYESKISLIHSVVLMENYMMPQICACCCTPYDGELFDGEFTLKLFACCCACCCSCLLYIYDIEAILNLILLVAVHYMMENSIQICFISHINSPWSSSQKLMGVVKSVAGPTPHPLANAGIGQHADWTRIATRSSSTGSAGRVMLFQKSA